MHAPCLASAAASFDGTLDGAALHRFVSDAGQAFPSSCRLAVGFSDADIIGPAIDDLCGGALTSVTSTQPTAPLLVDGPFAPHGTALYLEPALYVHGSRPVARDDSTVQFWIRPEGPVPFKAAVFSDIDENTGRGLAIHSTPRAGSRPPSSARPARSRIPASASRSPRSRPGGSCAWCTPPAPSRSASTART